MYIFIKPDLVNDDAFVGYCVEMDQFLGTYLPAIFVNGFQPYYTTLNDTGKWSWMIEWVEEVTKQHLLKLNPAMLIRSLIDLRGLLKEETHLYYLGAEHTGIEGDFRWMSSEGYAEEHLYEVFDGIMLLKHECKKIEYCNLNAMLLNIYGSFDEAVCNLFQLV